MNAPAAWRGLATATNAVRPDRRAWRRRRAAVIQVVLARPPSPDGAKTLTMWNAPMVCAMARVVEKLGMPAADLWAGPEPTGHAVRLYGRAGGRERIVALITQGLDVDHANLALGWLADQAHRMEA